MFTTSKNEPTNLEQVIDLALTRLKDIDPASEDYSKIVDQLDKLHKMLPKKESWVKPDVLLPIAGNLAGIIAILNHERAHVIATKALGFVMKTRV